MVGAALKLSVLGVLLFVCCSQGTVVERVGNKIKPSAKGSIWPGTTFLLDNVALKDGVLFAFRGYFRNFNPVQFQIWRVMNETQRVYKMVADYEVSPTLPKNSEDFYLHLTPGAECVRVKKGDRLGVLSNIVPGSIAYIFNSSAPNVLAKTVTNVTFVPKLNELVTFNDLLFPYVFSFAAYIDTNLTKYPANDSIECPSDIKIPEDPVPQTTPATPVTGAPGIQGPEGPKGDTGPKGADGAKGENGLQGPKGDTGDTGQNGASGVDGAKGAMGPTGPEGGVGATGQTGPQGDSGVPGDRGLRGPAGKDGADAPTVSPIDFEALRSECKCGEGLLQEYLILAVLIWLALVTLLMIIQWIVLCCHIGKRKDKQMKTNLEHIYANPTLPAVYDNVAAPGDSPTRKSWMNGMREESWEEYPTQSIPSPAVAYSNQVMLDENATAF